MGIAWVSIPALIGGAPAHQVHNVLLCRLWQIDAGLATCVTGEDIDEISFSPIDLSARLPPDSAHRQ